MSFYNAIYLSLIFCSLVLAAKSYWLGGKKSLYLVLVLLATLIVEIFSTLSIAFHLHFDWAYHLFNPIEYTLFCLYYLKACEVNKYKNIIRLSIPAFCLTSLLLSTFRYGFHSMPAMNINLEGFLLMILYTHLLFAIETDMYVPVHRYTDFWIAVGVMIFFGGAFVFLGLYPRLFDLNFDATMQLFGVITRPLNIVLYTCIIIGYLCSVRKKNYLTS